jgi:hypothetical protein
VKYAVLVMDKEPNEEKFAAAVMGERMKPRSVYVVGMEDGTEFYRSLSDKPTEIITITDPVADEMMEFTFSEAIGTEASLASFDNLIEIAKQRAVQLQKGSP